MKHLNILLHLTLLPGPEVLLGQLAIDSLHIVDYQVHVYSEDLTRNLELQDFSFERFGFEISEKNPSAYRNIDEIIRELKLDPKILKQIIERDIFEELKK